MLSKRLQAIADWIEPSKTVIDIGCDHALLDIALTQSKKNNCIASDINENALFGAKKNIEKYHLEHQITLLISNGLEQIDIPTDHTIVISGMGTSTILDILSSPKKNQIESMILVSHNEHSRLRNALVDLNFKIVDEKIIRDKNIYYLLMKIIPGKILYSKKECFLGPILTKKTDNETKEYYQNILRENQKISKNIPHHQFKKRWKITQQIKWIKERG